MKRPILLLLRTPPPYGGGELIQQLLYRHYSRQPNYRFIRISSKQRTKANQGIFSVWKLREFIHTFIRVLVTLIRTKPGLLFFAMGKGFPHFLRDSAIVIFARLLSVSVVVEIHGTGLYFLGHNQIYSRYAKIVCKQITSIRVLSESIQNAFAEHGILNTVAIDNGVDVPKIRTRRSLNPACKINFLFVGTLGKHKGFDLVMQATAMLKADGDIFTVHCLGPWVSEQYKENSIKWLKQNHLMSHYVFYGLLHGDDKWDVYRTCDILLLPSYNEGQPLVILEAFAFGLGVIASSIGAIPETVNNGVNGILTNPGCLQDLYEAIHTLIHDPSRLKKMQESNRIRFDGRYTVAKFLRQHERWLQECAAKSSQS